MMKKHFVRTAAGLVALTMATFAGVILWGLGSLAWMAVSYFGLWSLVVPGGLLVAYAVGFWLIKWDENGSSTDEDHVRGPIRMESH